MINYDEIISKLFEHFSYFNIGDDMDSEYRLTTAVEINFNSYPHQIWNMFAIFLISFVIVKNQIFGSFMRKLIGH